MSKIVRINKGNYDLFVTSTGTITFHDTVTVGTPNETVKSAGTGDFTVGHDATIYNDLTVHHDLTVDHDTTIKHNLTVGNMLDVPTISVDKLIGDPIDIEGSVRFLFKSASEVPVNHADGILVYSKQSSDLLWYVDNVNSVHTIPDTRKALAYSLIF